MKKEFMKVLIAILICFLAIGTVCFAISVYIQRNEAENYTATCEKYGYVAYWDKMNSDEKAAIIINTYDEYKKCVENITNAGTTSMAYREKLQSYDESFFDENDLILRYYRLKSGSTKLKFDRLDVIDGVGYIRTKRVNLNSTGTDDMAYWGVFVEVSKSEGVTMLE